MKQKSVRSPKVFLCLSIGGCIKIILLLGFSLYFTNVNQCQVSTMVSMMSNVLSISILPSGLSPNFCEIRFTCPSKLCHAACR